MNPFFMTFKNAEERALIEEGCAIAERLIEALPDNINGAVGPYVLAAFTARIVDSIFDESPDGTLDIGNASIRQRREAVDVIANLAKQFLALPTPANTAGNA